MKRAAARVTAVTSEPEARTPSPSGRALRVALQPLLLAKGADGPWSGRPDPTLVVCAWAVDDGPPRTILKGVVRFAVSGRLPCEAMPDTPLLQSAALRKRAKGGKRRAVRVMVCLTLFEENDGDDIRALAAALEHPDTLCFVHESDGLPVVRSVAESAADVQLHRAQPRDILVERAHASATKSDQWWAGRS